MCRHFRSSVSSVLLVLIIKKFKFSHFFIITIKSTLLRQTPVPQKSFEKINLEIMI